MSVNLRIKRIYLSIQLFSKVNINLRNNLMTELKNVKLSLIISLALFKGEIREGSNSLTK